MGRLTGEDGLAKHEALDRFFVLAELFGISSYNGLILKVNARVAGPARWATRPRSCARRRSGTISTLRPTAPAAVPRALAGPGPPDVALRMPHKDGSDRWVSWSVVVAAGLCSLPSAATSP